MRSNRCDGGCRYPASPANCQQVLRSACDNKPATTARAASRCSLQTILEHQLPPGRVRCDSRSLHDLRLPHTIDDHARSRAQLRHGTGDDVANQFQKAMRLMRSNDAQTQEDGFHQLRPHVVQHLDELIIEFNRETAHGLRCWLLELIGEARAEQALPVLIDQLHGDDESLRFWAVRGLERLDTKQARRELYQARTTGLIP
ncbi:HEAT repeat domain-containing protein [Micromonospora zamorensis]|uniref:HEAT repeat domain-containing protein n=1 Tax=Micromonospora zamorensis TaxID=709883 RepID=UPI0033A0F39F